MRPPIALPLALLVSIGCGNGGQAKGPLTPQGEALAVGGASVTDDAFATAVHDLLRCPLQSRERALRLVPVVAKQLNRAQQLYAVKSPDKALVALTGGLYLVRIGEFRSDLVGETGLVALRNAARDLAHIGDEGRARALYELLARVTHDQDQRDVRGHLDALAVWSRETAGLQGSLVRAGALERSAVARRLLEPSQDAIDDATGAVGDWVRRALALRMAFRHNHMASTREEATEAFRALQTGMTTLIALHLIEGDAAGAMRAIERYRAREIVSPELFQALESLASRPDALGYLEVLQALQSRDERTGDHGDDDDQTELLRAAAFRVGMEAYRLDPTVPEAAGAVAAGLQQYGMAEASPLILLEAVTAHPDTRTISGALTIIMQAMTLEVEADSPDSARRVFRAAAPLLALADAENLVGKLKPSAPRVRSLMGEIELGEGQITEAKALFSSAVKTEATAVVLLLLARVEGHLGESAAALAHLRRADHEADQGHNHALRGEILLTMSDMLREQGDVANARPPLVTALNLLVRSRGGSDIDEKIRVERVLARVLDRFGADQLAQRALDRALMAASHDKRQLSGVLSQQIGRALVRGDLAAAREGLNRGVAADLEDDDLVYFALWVWLLERQIQTTTDGSPGRIFASLMEDGRWEGKLASFGAGKLTSQELIAGAKTTIEKVEALFYTAMDRRVSGRSREANEDLARVVHGPGLELIEASLAREILEPTHGTLGALPPNVAIP